MDEKELPLFIYSGRILKEHPFGDDLLWLYISREENDGQTLQIESEVAPVRIKLTLNKKQVEAMHRCLYNALESWAGRNN